MIEWISSTQGRAVTELDAGKMTVTIRSGEAIKANVINLIPRQAASGASQ